MSLEQEIRSEIRDLLRDQLGIGVEFKADDDGDIRIVVSLRINGSEFDTAEDIIPSSWIREAVQQ